MLTGVMYDSEGRLVDDTGHSWKRVSSWVAPVDAEAAVQAGCRFMVQSCMEPPIRGRAERLRRDILPLLLTRQEAQAFAGKSSVPTVFIAELLTKRSRRRPAAVRGARARVPRRRRTDQQLVTTLAVSGSFSGSPPAEICVCTEPQRDAHCRCERRGWLSGRGTTDLAGWTSGRRLVLRCGGAG
jgi:hypothetical protein